MWIGLNVGLFIGVIVYLIYILHMVDWELTAGQVCVVSSIKLKSKIGGGTTNIKPMLMFRPCIYLCRCSFRACDVTVTVK